MMSYGLAGRLMKTNELGTKCGKEQHTILFMKVCIHFMNRIVIFFLYTVSSQLSDITIKLKTTVKKPQTYTISVTLNRDWCTCIF